MSDVSDLRERVVIELEWVDARVPPECNDDSDRLVYVWSQSEGDVAFAAYNDGMVMGAFDPALAGFYRLDGGASGQSKFPDEDVTHWANVPFPPKPKGAP